MKHTELSTRDCANVRAIVKAKAGIALSADKDFLVQTRLEQLFHSDGALTPGTVMARLRSGDRATTQKVVDAMTTNETMFFRDQRPFEALRTEIIPRAIEQNAASRRLRIWCAACSTGQEPYSLAMLLATHFPLPGWEVEVLATDISEASMAQATEGLYRQFEVNRGLPAAMLLEHFEQRGARWAIKDHIKQMVRFEKLNLLGAWPWMPKMDVVLLRNVLIYFDVETKRRVLARVRQAMAPQGALLLGGAETMVFIDESFERIEVARTSYYRPQPRTHCAALS